MKTGATANERAVSRFEYDLVRILRFLLGYLPPEQALTQILARKPAPNCLSADGVHLVRDSLAKGIVLFLVRAGGWRDERFLRQERVVSGRIWDRSPLPERSLSFSRHVLSFLIWITAEKPSEAREKWDAPSNELTPADELFFALAIEALRAEPTLFEILRAKAVFERNPFCWIMAPADFALTEASQPPSMTPLFQGQRAIFLECLQPYLQQKWLRNERTKGQISDWKRMRNQGQAELATLQAFLTAAATTSRTDLARFLLKTLSELLAGQTLDPSFWIGGLSKHAPARLSERLATHRAALAVLQQADTLGQWDRRARSVGYFDEDYQASQLWKDDFEKARGTQVQAQAHAILEKIEPLRASEAEQP